jgi:hypothetical protein
VHTWSGQCNKNLGNAFVIVWRIGDEHTLAANQRGANIRTMKGAGSTVGMDVGSTKGKNELMFLFLTIIWQPLVACPPRNPPIFHRVVVQQRTISHYICPLLSCVSPHPYLALHHTTTGPSATSMRMSSGGSDGMEEPSAAAKKSVTIDLRRVPGVDILGTSPLVVVCSSRRSSVW